MLPVPDPPAHGAGAGSAVTARRDIAVTVSAAVVAGLPVSASRTTGSVGLLGGSTPGNLTLSDSAVPVRLLLRAAACVVYPPGAKSVGGSNCWMNRYRESVNSGSTNDQLAWRVCRYRRGSVVGSAGGAAFSGHSGVQATQNCSRLRAKATNSDSGNGLLK